MNERTYSRLPHARFLAALLASTIVGALDAPAAGLILKDGTVIAARALRRQGDTIVATVALPGGEGKIGDLGYPLARIERLDFPEPPQLKACDALIPAGKGAEAVAQLEPVVKFYEGFRDAPGSWWAAAAILKAQALSSIGRDDEATTLAEQIARLAAEEETRRAASVLVAANHARKGNHARAQELIRPVLEQSHEPSTRAPAFIVQGECLLARKEWEEAVLAFLQVPVFFPDEKPLLPSALLGRGRAHFGMDDLPTARAVFQELIDTYPASSEARLARTELEKLTRREKALAPPK